MTDFSSPIEDETTGSALIIGLVTLLLAAFVLWASVTEIDEVTRGDGRVIPAQKTQVIQSAEPGIIAEIFVRLGERVTKGDLLVRLDKTTTSANLGEVEAKTRSLTAQIARLRLEHLGTMDTQYKCPLTVMDQAPGVCATETLLYEVRRKNLTSRVAGAEERLEQKRRELGETDAEIVRLTESLALARQELALIAPMAKRKVVSDVEHIRIKRTVADLSGQLKTAVQSKRRLESSLREATLQVEEQRLIFRQTALSELREKEAELSVVNETIRGASERLRRTDIRSPVDGIVNELIINTRGAFVNAGERVLSIVPVGDTLLVEARITPRDIAFIHLGQPAVVKVTAFDFSIFGGLEGQVENVAADTVLDPVTKDPFYTVIIRTSGTTLKSKRGSNEIIPGMICNVEIMTGRKTVMQYLLKPLNKARQEAFRER